MKKEWLKKKIKIDENNLKKKKQQTNQKKPMEVRKEEKRKISIEIKMSKSENKQQKCEQDHYKLQ